MVDQRGIIHLLKNTIGDLHLVNATLKMQNTELQRKVADLEVRIKELQPEEPEEVKEDAGKV